MSTLPEGWEADYDGSRWFYRYKATGIVQYQFPRDGDEFPEWYGDGGDDVPIEPEAWLASEQQVRRRSTLGSDPENPPGEMSPKAATSRRKRSESIPEDDEMSATGYFDPSSFMYFGPGGDISPVGEEDDGAGAEESTTHKSATPIPSAGPTPSTIHSQVSPMPEPPAQIDPHALAAELPEDNAQLWKPTGFVAELPTLDTQKCAEELAPVEMDGTSHIPTPMQPTYGSVELPTHREPKEPKTEEPVLTTNTGASITPPVHTVTEYPLVSASFAYPAVSGGSTPSRHPTSPQPQSSNVSTPSRHQSPQQSPPIVSNDMTRQRSASPQKMGGTKADTAKFQPWTPSKNVIEGSSSYDKRSSLILSGPSVLQAQESELGHIRRPSESASVPPHQSTQHNSLFSPPQDPRVLGTPTSVSSLSSASVSAATPSLPRSPIPQILQPANLTKRASVPEVPDLSRMDTRQPQAHGLPGSSARHASISSGSRDGNKGDAHPIILTPARRDLHRVQSSQNPSADFARQASPHPPARPASAFPGYVAAQRGLQNSPATGQQAQPSSRTSGTTAFEWLVHPPGPRRLHSEPYLPVTGGGLPNQPAAAASTGGREETEGIQELSSEPSNKSAQSSGTSMPISSTQARTESMLQTSRAPDTSLETVRPLNLTRSKSPSPGTRTVEALGTKHEPMQTESIDLISEVISAMDSTIRSGSQGSASLQTAEPQPTSGESPAQASSLPAQRQEVYTSVSSLGSGSAQINQSRAADLSLPSVTSQALVSPLSSPAPSRQQSLSSNTRQPPVNGVDGQRNDIPQMSLDNGTPSRSLGYNQSLQDQGPHIATTEQAPPQLVPRNAQLALSNNALPPTTAALDDCSLETAKAPEVPPAQPVVAEATHHDRVVSPNIVQQPALGNSARPQQNSQLRLSPSKMTAQSIEPLTDAETTTYIQPSSVESSAKVVQDLKLVDGLRMTSRQTDSQTTTITVAQSQGPADIVPPATNVPLVAAPINALAFPVLNSPGNQTDMTGNSSAQHIDAQEGIPAGSQPQQTTDVVTSTSNIKIPTNQTQEAQGQTVQKSLADTQHQLSEPTRGSVSQQIQDASLQDLSQQSAVTEQIVEVAPKPFPMLPGQVTPLPSQIGSEPVPLPVAVADSTPDSKQVAASPRSESFPQKSAQMNAGAAAPHHGGQLPVAPVLGDPKISVNVQPMAQSGTQGQPYATQTGSLLQPQQANANVNPTQPNSTMTDAGKSMRKWAKKMFSSSPEKANTPMTSVTPARPGIGTSNVPQHNMYKPGPVQQKFQVQGPAQTLGQLPPAQMYNLPVRPQPPLMAVPENQPLGPGPSQFAKQPVPVAMKPSASLPQLPQAQKQFQANQSPQGNQLNGPLNMQPAMQPSSQGVSRQPVAMAPGQPQQRLYQQQIGSHMAQIAANGQSGQGPLQPRTQGAGPAAVPHSRPNGGTVPANTSARRSSDSSLAQPSQQPPHRNSLPSQGPVLVGQFPSQQHVIQQQRGHQQQRVQQQPQQQVQRPTQQGVQQTIQQVVQQPGQQAPPRQTHVTAGGQISPNGRILPMGTQATVPAPAPAPAPHGQLPPLGRQSIQGPHPPQGQYPPQGQAHFSPSAQGQPGRGAPLPIKNVLGPQGQPPAQSLAPLTGGPAPPPGTAVAPTAQPPSSNSGHARTWSKGKADYSGGDWGDHWYDG